MVAKCKQRTSGWFASAILAMVMTGSLLALADLHQDSHGELNSRPHNANFLSMVPAGRRLQEAPGQQGLDASEPKQLAASAAEDTADSKASTLESTADLDGSGVEVEAIIADDAQQSATVRITYKGEVHTYNLQAVDLYGETGSVLHHRNRETYVGAPASRHFSTKVDDMHAVASIREDGMISGIFHNSKHGTMQLSHPENQFDIPHHKRRGAYRFESLQDLQNEDVLARQITRSIDGQVSALYTAGSNATGRRLQADPRYKTNPQLNGDAMASAHGLIGSNWGGDRFFPGCYPNDNNYHIFKIKVITDVRAWTKFSGYCQTRAENLVRWTSHLYELQFNVRLVLEQLDIYQDDASAPSYAQTSICNGGADNYLANRLNMAFGDAAYGSVQLFTGCGSGEGFVGIANVGKLCNTGAKGVSDVAGTSSAWITVAHELGHNFNAAHSSRGIMSLAETVYQGNVQFNRAENRANVCGMLTSRYSQCRSIGVLQIGDTSLTATTSSSASSTSTSPEYTGTSEGGWSIRSMTGQGCYRDRRYPNCIHSWGGNETDGMYTQPATCNIFVDGDPLPPLVIYRFSTRGREQSDRVVINGVIYSGKHDYQIPPNNTIEASGWIYWSASILHRPGWYMCRGPKQAATTTTTTTTSTTEPIRVNRLTLIDATTDTVIPAFDPLLDGAVIDLSQLGIGPDGINIVAHTTSTVQSLRWKLTDSGRTITYLSKKENQEPWSLYGDTNGDFNGENPAPGGYRLRCRPLRGDQAGPSYIVDFTIVAAR